MGAKPARGEEAQALYTITTIISSAEPMETVLRRALEKILATTGMPVAAVEIFPEAGEAASHRYVVGADGSKDLRSYATFAEFPMMAGARRAGALILASTETDPLEDWLHPWASAAAGILGCFAESRMATDALRSGKEKERMLLRELETTRKEFAEMRISQPGLDPVTSLPNAPLFHFLLAQAVARARRGKQTLAVLDLDLDRFRDAREQVGPENADKILKQVADRLKRSCREGDSVACADQDEFLWCVSHVQKPEDIAVIAEKALEAVARPISLEDREHIITTSIGISVFPYDGGDGETLLKCAQSALGRAKDLGRSTYQFYTDELNNKIQEQLSFKRRLRDALDSGEFILHYQPVLKTATRNVEAVEALIRWQKPEGNLSFPGEFLQASESAGLTARLDEWVIATACNQVRRWSDVEGRPLRVTVNISARLLEDSALPWKITSVIKEAGIRPEQLELDISQSLLMTDLESTGALLKRLKQTGVRVSMDDFGSGMLDLDSLREFPVDAIKIDPAFIRDIHSNPYTSAVTAGILSLARSLKIHAVAKGVENEEQLNHLKTLQCDAFQGNLHGAAISATEIPGFLDRSKTIVVSEGKLFEPAPEIEIVSTASTQSEWFEPSTSVASTPSAPTGSMYLITCFHCGAIFNAVEAPWCACIVTENTLICPQCGKCFCVAPVTFKMDFWSDAPQMMWERRMKEDSDEEPLAPNPPPQEAKRPLIMIVDDERAILVAGTRAIRSFDYTVIHASSGEQGLELARKYIPDLVITDALMPKLDGREMCRMIKLDPRMAKVKVAIVTTLPAGARERASALRDYKCDEFLPKPLTREQLESLLRQFAPKN